MDSVDIVTVNNVIANIEQVVTEITQKQTIVFSLRSAPISLCV